MVLQQEQSKESEVSLLTSDSIKRQAGKNRMCNNNNNINIHVCMC